MNKEQLVLRIAEKAGLTAKDTSKFLESYTNTIIEVLSEDQADDSAINLFGFGNFSVKKRKARKGRNPQTGEEIDIPAKNVVSFSPAKKFKDAVNS